MINLTEIIKMYNNEYFNTSRIRKNVHIYIYSAKYAFTNQVHN